MKPVECYPGHLRCSTTTVKASAFAFTLPTTWPTTAAVTGTVPTFDGVLDA